jgi:predicted RNase H-like nuclease
VSGARLLGLDLAWSPRNPSGAAVLDPAGNPLCARADLGDDREILAWIRSWLGTSGVIAFDMPTIVRNASGARPCERELAGVFARHHARPYPAHLELPCFRGGGRARWLIDQLRADGVIEATSIDGADGRNVAIEVFPHAALVRLFALERVLPYKKKQRPWATVLAAWSTYHAHLASLAAADPPLLLVDALVPRAVGARGYKQYDDMLDAITCAYVAAFVHRWGSELPHVRVFGDLETGYIVVPNRSAFGC